MPEAAKPEGVLLVSCYELGQQPLSLARAAAFLARAGISPASVDLAVDDPTDEELRRHRLIAVAVPMHAALRRAVRFARRVRAAAPQSHICFFGLYAALNAEYLLAHVVDSVLGGEPELTLVRLAESLRIEAPPREVPALGLRDSPLPFRLSRLDYPPALRDGLPALHHYVRLESGGRLHLVASIEASRGCRHLCRHCPIPPVYDGRFFAVPAEIVLEDARRAVAGGAEHLTFVDPDFLNGPTHARNVARLLRREHPGLTFDFTAKVEHLLRDESLLAELVSLGAVFAVTAVESLSDVVLAILDKGHTREDVFRVLAASRRVGLVLRPSLLPFTPWSTLADFLELLEWIDNEGLWAQIDPVQLSIRLLVPPSSRLEHHPDMLPHLTVPDPANFSIAWRHPDRRMDELQRVVGRLAAEGAHRGGATDETFRAIHAAAREAAGIPASRRERIIPPALAHSRPPRLTEPWFC